MYQQPFNNAHHVLECMYHDLNDLIRFHISVMIKNRPTPEIVSLQKRVDELEEKLTKEFGEPVDLFSLTMNSRIFNTLTWESRNNLEKMLKSSEYLVARPTATQYFFNHYKKLREEQLKRHRENRQKIKDEHKKYHGKNTISEFRLPEIKMDIRLKHLKQELEVLEQSLKNDVTFMRENEIDDLLERKNVLFRKIKEISDEILNQEKVG